MTEHDLDHLDLGAASEETQGPPGFVEEIGDRLP